MIIECIVLVDARRNVPTNMSPGWSVSD